ncbi:hypothetical protein C8R46DRAFT_1124713, partial [Mycena filopes]
MSLNHCCSALLLHLRMFSRLLPRIHGRATASIGTPQVHIALAARRYSPRSADMRRRRAVRSYASRRAGGRAAYCKM